LAFNFNNDPFSPPGGPSTALGASDGRTGLSGASQMSPTPTMSPGAAEPPAATPGPITSDNPLSAAFARFGSCRWQQPAEDGNAAFCTHREVKPYAGTTGFDANAWCTECQYYKLRRAPKKREPRDDYSY
jgi:hypothetical protein